MSGIMRLRDKLSIIITTYNRASLFEKTLMVLTNSPIRDCRITILNNHSTDNTYDVYKKYVNLFPDLKMITHPVNLGGGCENYIHAIEYCDTEYMWILADDDEYDFSNFDDVKEAILNSSVDVIQVGAHDDGAWNWGCYKTPRELYAAGYSYFKYSSFLPCTIFKYSYFSKYIKDAYNAISYQYPHYPCLMAAFENDVKIYVSKKRVLTAIWGNQTYGAYVCFRGTLLASLSLKSKKERREALSVFQSKKNFAYLIVRYILYYRHPQKVYNIQELYILFSLLFWYDYPFLIALFPILLFKKMQQSLKK
jgi:glycosyltransferase involved in cell wall biosynthesis